MVCTGQDQVLPDRTQVRNRVYAQGWMLVGTWFPQESDPKRSEDLVALWVGNPLGPLGCGPGCLHPLQGQIPVTTQFSHGQLSIRPMFHRHQIPVATRGPKVLTPTQITCLPDWTPVKLGCPPKVQILVRTKSYFLVMRSRGQDKFARHKCRTPFGTRSPPGWVLRRVSTLTIVLVHR